MSLAQSASRSATNMLQKAPSLFLFGFLAFTWVSVGDSQASQVKLMAADAEQNDYFGQSVAISGDTAVVGCPTAGFDSRPVGFAYVFVRDGSTWSEQAKLEQSDVFEDIYFGWSVAISGDTIVVGSYGAGAWVFTRTGSTWTQQARISPPAVGGSLYFGLSVAIHGDTVIVGDYAVDGVVNSSGAAYVFVRSGSTWTQQTVLTASDPGVGDEFGYSVAISGDTAVIGATRGSDGAERPGSAYVYFRTGSDWTQQSRILASAPATYFGESVSVSGNTVAVGCRYRAGGDSPTGSAYVFVRDGETWTEQDRLQPQDGQSGDSFGRSTAISGNAIVVGADGDDDLGDASGSAYLFTRTDSVWTQLQKLTADDGDFGTSSAIQWP